MGLGEEVGGEVEAGVSALREERRGEGKGEGYEGETVRDSAESSRRVYCGSLNGHQKCARSTLIQRNDGYATECKEKTV